MSYAWYDEDYDEQEPGDEYTEPDEQPYPLDGDDEVTD